MVFQGLVPVTLFFLDLRFQNIITRSVRGSKATPLRWPGSQADWRMRTPGCHSPCRGTPPHILSPPTRTPFKVSATPSQVMHQQPKFAFAHEPRGDEETFVGGKLRKKKPKLYQIIQKGIWACLTNAKYYSDIMHAIFVIEISTCNESETHVAPSIGWLGTRFVPGKVVVVYFAKVGTALLETRLGFDFEKASNAVTC